MNSVLDIRKQFRPYAGTILLALLIAAAVWLLHSYIDSSAVNFLFGMCALPFLIQHSERRVSFGWILLLMCFFVSVLFFLPAITFLFLAAVVTLLYILNVCWRSRIVYAGLVLLLMSPVASYIVSVFTFPIRIRMTEWVGTLLERGGWDIIVSGNTLSLDGTDFTVDAACMGLKMLEVSLIAGIFLIVHFEKKYNRRALAVGVFAYLLLVLGLNVFCNLFRMIILVAMKWMPNTLLHELTGIVCFGVYVILPAIYISRMIVKRWGIIYKQSVNFPKEFSAADGRKILMLLLFFVAGGLQFKYRNTRNAPLSQLSEISGYQLSASAEGISKYFDGHTLVYIKPVRVFFDTDHQPMLCWKGSGYVFAHVKAVDIHSYRVYMAQLKKGDNQLFSAWWYSNGERSTISQWDWRSQMLQGGGAYYLINVTCASVTELGKAIEEWHINKWLPSGLLIHSGSIGLFNNP